MNGLSINFPVYDKSCLWIVLPVNCPVCELSCLWNVLSINWSLSELSCLEMSCLEIISLQMVLSMNCPAYELFRPWIVLFYKYCFHEMLYLRNVLSMKSNFYEMSCISSVRGPDRISGLKDILYRISGIYFTSLTIFLLIFLHYPLIAGLKYEYLS